MTKEDIFDLMAVIIRFCCFITSFIFLFIIIIVIDLYRIRIKEKIRAFVFDAGTSLVSKRGQFAGRSMPSHGSMIFFNNLSEKNINNDFP